MQKTTMLIWGMATTSALCSAAGMSTSVANGYSNSSLTSFSADLASMDTVSLQEVTVSTNFVNPKSSPLRTTTLSNLDVKAAVSSTTFLGVMKGIPGLFATPETGSYGDATLNIRGFKQANLSILLNGIPISGLVSGSMYWNNWMGLSDATYQLQVQKGIGESMLADCSMGGSVNIITNTSAPESKTEFTLTHQEYGVTKGSLSWCSGQLNNGWSVAANVAYTKGEGYVKATGVETFSYMLNIGKVINENHTLLFTALGSPEEHNQRSTKMTDAERRTYGRSYNKNWGLLNGREYSLYRNHYYKPYFTLQHIMSQGRLRMRNSLDLAIADGGGRYNETATGGKSLIATLTPDGQVDFTTAIANNRTWSKSTTLSPGDGCASQAILTDYMSGHIQGGGIMTAEYDVTDDWTLGAGLHGLYYKTWEKEQITDLLGGDFWYEDYATKSLAGMAGRNPIKHVGDYVRTRNGKTTVSETAYLSARYSDHEHWDATLGLSFYFGQYQRRDSYNYIGEAVHSDWANGKGMSVKAGILYHMSDDHSVYVNGGYASRLPYASNYFASSNNAITPNVKNEKNLQGELGWRWQHDHGNIELSGYVASWRDKTLTSNKYKRLDEDAVKYMITGMDAFHYGIELTARQELTDWFTLTAFASFGEWKWMSDVEATIYDEYSDQPLGEYNVYADGLHVGDAPQTQLGAKADVKLPGGFYVAADWRMNSRMYADFEPSSRTNPADRHDSYRIPTYHLLDGQVGWTNRLNTKQPTTLTLFITGTNLTDATYVERATDGTAHNLASLKGYWGLARTTSFGMRISF